MKKRLLSILLALSMMLTILPLNAITAFAADNGTCGNGLTWELSEDGVLTIRGSGAMTNYDDTYNKAPWRENDSSKIRSVAFDGNVTSIGDFAFYQCKNLTEVTIPESVTSIGYDAFGYSGLTSVRIPSSVISVGDYAFQDCSGLNSIDIQNAVIGQRQFYNCKALTTVTIPNTVTTWGEYAFGNCTGLKTVVLANGVTSIGDYAFYNALTTKDDGSTITVTIPDTVTTIGESAFSGCTGLKTIALSSNITAVNRNTFAGSGLTEIAIPSKVTSIGYRAFALCVDLKEVSIPESVKTIGQNAFFGCTNLKTVNIPGGVNAIESNTFSGCTSLKSIAIPSSVKNIYSSAFEGAGLEDLVIPEGVTSLGGSAFSKCPNLLTVKLPSSLSKLGYMPGGVFQDCPKLWKVEFENPETGSGKLSQLNYYTFKGCVSLTDVSLPDSLTKIDLEAFKGCSALKTIDLPEKVTSIDSSAFQDCTSLTSITLPATAIYGPSISSDAFKGCTNLTIYSKDNFYKLKTYGEGRITGLIGLNTGDTQIQYDGQDPIDLVYQCNVYFYAKANNSSNYSRQYANDTSVYRKQTVASDKAPTLESKDGYTLSWRVGSADGEEFKFDETPVPSDLSLYAVYTLDTKGVTVSAGVTVKVPGAADVVSDGTTPVQVKPNTEITLEAPELADGDAYEWTHGDSVVTENNSNEYTFTVAGDTTIKLSTLKALHITEGKPNITGTKYDATSDTYYGNGWEYSKNAGLTIKADKNLSEEPAVTVKVTVASGVTVFNAYLKGEVTNNGTLSNCALDKAPTGGTVENSLFGTKPNDAAAKTLTEADGKDITAKLDGVKDGSLTGTELWFVGSPKLTVKVDSDPATEIKHINHKSVNETDNYDGVTGTVAIDSTEHSVTFTPDGNDNILLNNRTAVTGDFTFNPEPKNCTYDGTDHGVGTGDITYNNTSDGNSIASVKYEYKKPDWQEGDDVEEVTEAKNAGTYTVKIVMSDGQTIDTGKSFTISPAEPSADDFTVVKNPNGVTEDRDDSEKTMKVALKSDSLFSNDNSNVDTKYQKKNASGEWEDVTAPSGKGEYRLVATVTTTDPNLTGGTVTWEFTILDREDASWLEMTVEDGKITKVVRPAADDAEEDITEKVLLTASADGSKTAYRVPAGAAVTVTANDAPQDMKFEMWRFSVNSMNGDTVLALYSRSMTFTMKDDLAGLTVSAMYQDAAIDSGYDILGPAAAATTVVVGSAVLAYQGHQLGTELYLIYLLPSGAVIPANRIQLALLLWQDAGNPAPVDETPYSDIGADDTDAMQAAQWAVETGLMDLPDPDSAPDQFDPYTAVSNVDVIHAWKKAQKVKG